MALLQHAPKRSVKHAPDIDGDNAAMSIKTRIQQRMDDLGLKVPDVAKGAGVSNSAVYQWLDGSTRPGIEAIVGLSEVLRTYVRWLVFGRGAKDRSSLMELRADEEALIVAYRNVRDENTKRGVYEIVLKLGGNEGKKTGEP